jgi:hypothetical protein
MAPTEHVHNIEIQGSPNRMMPGAAARQNRRDIEALTARISELENRMSAVLASLSRTSADRSEKQARHQVIARRYRQFLDQDLVDALHSVSRHADVRFDADELKRLAEIARDMCICLFALPVVTTDSLYELLGIPGNAGEEIARRLADIAGQMRSDWPSISASPWYFSFIAGRHLDRAYQEPWEKCSADAFVGWVVAPAYVAEGQVIVKQRVYTYRD